MYELEEMILRIKSIKKQKKLSNEELSKLSGVPIGTLAKILGSETKDPRISNILEIAKALDVSADYLIFGKDVEVSGILPIVQIWNSLNSVGQGKLIQYADDLIKIDEYKKCPASEEQEVS